MKPIYFLAFYFSALFGFCGHLHAQDDQHPFIKLLTSLQNQDLIFSSDPPLQSAPYIQIETSSALYFAI